MVGRPNFPPDVDERDDLRGAAEATPGLTALDEEREASLADEGGASGMHVETQDPAERQHIADTLPVSHLTRPEPDTVGVGRWGLAGLVLAAAVGALAVRRLAR